MMAVDGINIWTSSWKAEGIRGVSTRFSLSVKNEQRRLTRDVDGRTYLARSNSQARTGTG